MTSKQKKLNESFRFLNNVPYHYDALNTLQFMLRDLHKAISQKRGK